VVAEALLAFQAFQAFQAFPSLASLVEDREALKVEELHQEAVVVVVER
jgi:hypothetical protein